MTNLKEKLIIFLESKGYKKSNIDELAAVPKQLFSGEKMMRQGISETILLRIVTTFPDLDLDWWLRNEGTDMTRKRSNNEDTKALRELIQAQKELITELREKISRLESENKSTNPKV